MDRLTKAMDKYLFDANTGKRITLTKHQMKTLDFIQKIRDADKRHKRAVILKARRFG